MHGSWRLLIALPALLACGHTEPAQLILEAPGEVDVSVRAHASSAAWYLDVKRDGRDMARIPSSGFLDTSAAYVINAKLRADEQPAVVDIVPMRCTGSNDRSCAPAVSRLSAGTYGWTLAASPDKGDTPEIQLLLAPRGFRPGKPPAGPKGTKKSETDSKKGTVANSKHEDTGRAGSPVHGAANGDVRVVVVGQKDGSPFFTSLKEENRLRLRADVREHVAANEVHWELVADSTANGWRVSPPGPGVESELDIAAPASNRWASVKHKAPLGEKALHVAVVAVVQHGGQTLRSSPITIEQDDISALRQEYVDLGVAHGAPPRSVFVRMDNNGDYQFRVFRPGFKKKLDSLLTILPADKRVINSEYRNPVHNRFHVGAGSGTGPISNSWHQYGCAADIQTFPATGGGASAADKAAAETFWEALAAEALERGFRVEPRTGPISSGVGHVHVEIRDCT